MYSHFPEEARVLAVASDQILLKNVQISYHQFIRIKLTVTEAGVNIVTFSPYPTDGKNYRKLVFEGKK